MTDLVLEIVRALIMSVILVYLWSVGRKEDIRRQEGWWYILAGFALLFFGILIDITDNFPSLNAYIVIGDTGAQAFLEKVVGYLLGFLLLAIGFWKWMPTIVALREAQKALAVSHDELEVKVVERTADLKAVNEQLRQEIAERGRVEEALRESEVRLASFMDSATDSFLLLDSELNIIEMNRTALERLGPNKEDFIGRNLSDLSPRLKETGRYDKYMEVMRTGEPFSVDDFVPDPRFGDMHITLKAFRAGDGLGIIATDITEWVRAKEEVQGLAKFPSENPNPVLRVTQDGTVIYANEAAEPLLNLWGCQEGQPLPDNWRHFTSGVFISGLSENIEVEYDDRILSLTFAPVMGTNYVNVYGLDITEGKRAEEALREREQRYRALFEHTNDAVFFISLDGIHLAANQQAADMLGYEIDELIGMSMRDVVVPDEYDDTQQKLKALLAGESLPVYERIFRKKDGAEFPVEINVALAYDAEGNPLHLQSVVRDITERKRVEQMKDEFVSTVSHELRTPLASIMGFTEILLSGQPGELTPTQREFLDISYQSSQRLLHLVEDLLAVSRIEADKLQFRFELLRMDLLVANIVEAIKPLAEDKEIALSVESPAQLPSVEGDRKRLEQVINNLLSNAIKFTPEGGRVLVSLDREGNQVKVGVADTGIGIQRDELPLLFQKFSRTSSAAERAVEGTGLGLYISRAIVERHGGRIWAESPSTRKRSDLRAGEPGKGSIFWFTLPLRQPKPTELRQGELARDIAARFFDSSEK